ncbi:MAG TPA: Stp1/IreP family PP2C-type Ser/Thr phosphatase [Anaerovoracaceae bacterium]|nr:Stp1/IreP family PP2C-type Ser/Thr phosphatase [Anaerovoracaceae bacterium]
MVRAACLTDKGKKRTINEDSMLCMETLNFYMLADGVGGHNSGEVASRLAVELTEKYLTKHPPKSVAESDLCSYFDDCLQLINKEIYGRSKQQKENYGMATTAVMLFLRRGKAYIVNIGDSRAYINRKGCLNRITEDHTYVNELLKRGYISEEEANVHPKRNMITKALGIEEAVKPDFYQINTYKGDRILLCTDGLYNEVGDDDINKLMNERSDIKVLVSDLIDLAYNNGGKDNITVNCVEI